MNFNGMGAKFLPPEEPHPVDALIKQYLATAEGAPEEQASAPDDKQPPPVAPGIDTVVVAPSAPPTGPSKPRFGIPSSLSTLKQAQMNAKVSNLGADVSDRIAAAFTRRAPPPSRLDTSVEDLAQQQQAGASDAAAARKAALDDPNSPESQKVRDALAGTEIGKRLRDNMEKNGAGSWQKLAGSFFPADTTEKILLKEAEIKKEDPSVSIYRLAMADAANAKTDEGKRKIEETANFLKAARSEFPDIGIPEDISRLDSDAIKKFIDVANQRREYGRDIGKLKLAQGFTGEQKGLDRQSKIDEEQRAVTTHAAQDKIPFIGGDFVPVDPANPPKPEELAPARAKAAAASTVISQLEKVRGLVQELIAHPANREVRSSLKAKFATIAPTINVALGQGAMASSEFDRAKDAMGGDPGGAGFWASAAEKLLGDQNSAAPFLASIDATQQYFDDMARTTAKSHNLKLVQRNQAAPTQQKAKPDAVSRAKELIKQGKNDDEIHKIMLGEGYQ